MSQQLISRNKDLKALVDDGYEVEVKAGHLVIHNVPYVNGHKQVKRGKLVSELKLAGDVTTKPKTHVVLFAGEYPCDKEGRPLAKIKHQSNRKTIFDGLVIDHSFSSKPKAGYGDYHEKMTTYVAIISGHAHALDPAATAQTRRVIETDDESPFKYIDTASSRAGIAAITSKLEGARIGIIGLGGTGSYILDLVAKTPVREIHLFDGDEFCQHNAFRSPGAPSADELKEIPKKVEYWARRYAPMRHGIITHDFHIDDTTVDSLEGLDFVFLCVDKGNVKLAMIEKLEALDVPFIDVGMGIEIVEDQLQGIVRVTTSTPEKRDHVRDKQRIGLTGGEADGVYSHNIQIADLNALNAALAVIKWKKICGFYQDFDQEHFMAYTLDGNTIMNEDRT
jgi:hypothetical protein